MKLRKISAAISTDDFCSSPVRKETRKSFMGYSVMKGDVNIVSACNLICELGIDNKTGVYMYVYHYDLQLARDAKYGFFVVSTIKPLNKQ